MRVLNLQEIEEVHGGVNFFKVISATVLGATIGAVIGAVTGGPAGAVAGAIAGGYNATAGVLIKEGADSLVDTLHPELSSR